MQMIRAYNSAAWHSRYLSWILVCQLHSNEVFSAAISDSIILQRVGEVYMHRACEMHMRIQILPSRYVHPSFT